MNKGQRERNAEAERERGARRSKAVQDILNEADERDTQANARDYAANRREMAATLDELLNEQPNTEAVKARDASALDRARARADRAASKGDRTRLADEAADDPEPPA